MTRMVTQGVRNILSQIMHQPSTAEDDRMGWRSRGVGSLDLLRLVVECEETFGVPIGDQDFVRLRCVDDLVNYVASRVQCCST
jgi:acyl carrier protein